MSIKEVSWLQTADKVFIVGNTLARRHVRSLRHLRLSNEHLVVGLARNILLLGVVFVHVNLLHRCSIF